MFEVGFSEMLVIAFVALVVLGPEKLPKAARFAGLWIRRARAQWYSVKAELEREIAAEQLKSEFKGGYAELDWMGSHDPSPNLAVPTAIATSCVLLAVTVRGSAPCLA